MLNLLRQLGGLAGRLDCPLAGVLPGLSQEAVLGPTSAPLLDAVARRSASAEASGAEYRGESRESLAALCRLLVAHEPALAGELLVLAAAKDGPLFEVAWALTAGGVPAGFRDSRGW